MTEANDDVGLQTVVIPDDAVGPTGADAGRPAVDLLRRLNLLPTKADLKEAGGPKATFAGPPDSVAVIEAGVTAASKWWSVAIGASSTGLATALVSLWRGLGENNQPFALLAAGLAIAAGTIGIAYILGSDVRGRSAAMVATIESRSRVASVVLQEAQESKATPAQEVDVVVISLAAVLDVSNGLKHGTDEHGWKAISARQEGKNIEYLLVKGLESIWVSAEHVKF